MSAVLEKRFKKDKVLVEPWTDRAVRVRHTRMKDFKPFDWALTVPSEVNTSLTEGETSILTLPGMSVSIDEKGYLDFIPAGASEPSLSEKRSPRALHEGGRSLKSVAGDLFRGQVMFEPYEDEKIWGLGQHQYNAFDQKGLVIPLNQMNSQVTVPLMISSRGYGVFWNNPAVGRVELARNRTCWVAERTEQIDYFVICGENPAEILKEYYAITGLPSALPGWATGFWQCKLRYETQDEIMTVAREHKKRGLPMSVIVVDYFHWVKQGIWDFDPKCWPEPEQMVKELKDMGIETMVSVWPSVNPDSPYFDEMEEKGYLLETEKSNGGVMRFTDTYEAGKKYQHFYDATDRDAGDFIWSKVKKSYLDRGIQTYWLDACEPETIPYDYENFRYSEGNGAAVGCLYPMLHEKTFYENMKNDGVETPLNLCRSAWAGSHKYGAAVWSGDIDSTFESLETQMKAGLNIISSGIPWWTTDIGGFYGGDISDSSFRELIVRWFQFGLYCPIFRLHGFRNSWNPKKGADNEVWSFGEEAYDLIVKYLNFRESLRPYIEREAARTVSEGLPLMRPLIFDFFDDKKVCGIEDQFLFGSDIMVAPVYRKSQREREVYLPTGVCWINAYTGKIFEGGQKVAVKAPLGEIPTFLRKGSKLLGLYDILK